MEEKEDQKIKHDFARFTFSTINDQIKQADTKAFGILGTLGILTVALLTRLANIKSATGITPTWIILFIISALLIILALKSVIIVVFPRLNKNDINERSILYFQDIAAEKKINYVQKASNYKNDQILSSIYRDIHNISNIANLKFTALRKSLIISIITFIWTIVIILLSYG
ncbi:MAG: DUF5706 domain-containing protein [Nanoarchaeota archaeon]|nr:DUF5706 domain-containing protein [Nanoarchaeota archaeon]